jgi:hypothetical protein
LALAILPLARARQAAAVLGVLVASLGGLLLWQSAGGEPESLFARASSRPVNPILGELLSLSGAALGLASLRRRAARVVAQALGVGVLAICVLGAGAELLARWGRVGAALPAALPLPVAVGFMLAILGLAAWLEIRGAAGTLLFARNGSARALRRAIPPVFLGLAAIHSGIFWMAERGEMPLAAALMLLLIANSTACGLVVLVSVRCVLPPLRALLTDLDREAPAARILSFPMASRAAIPRRVGSPAAPCAILKAKRRE